MTGSRLLCAAMTMCFCATANAQTASPTASPSEDVEQVLDEAMRVREEPLSTIDRPLYRGLQEWKKDLNEQHGINWALENTTIYQRTSGGIDPNDALVNTLGFFGTWKIFRDENGKEFGGIGFQAETRGNLLDDDFTDLADQEPRQVDDVRTQIAQRARPGRLLPQPPVHREARVHEPVLQVRCAEVADFAQLASKNSIGPSAQRGGDLGYFTAPEMVKPFSDVAFSLKKGQVSDKPVKTQFGWHVIKVEDVRTRKVPPYEKVKPQVEREVWEKLGEDFLRQYREQTKVQRYSLDGKTALPADPPAKPSAPAAGAKPK